MSHRLRAIGVRFAYKRHPALFQALDLSVGVGSTLLLGPNGAGKTSLLRLLAGELTPSAGEVRVEGSIDTVVAHEVAYMPQEVRSMAGLTVLEQVAYAGWLAGLTPHESSQRAEEALVSVQMSEYADRRPAQLPGGQRRRVALAQTLVTRSPFLLLDEPTAGLDPAQRHGFRSIVSELSREHGILISTHDTAEIDSTYDNVVVLSTGQVVFQGSVDDFLLLGDGPHPAETAFLSLVKEQ